VDDCHMRSRPRFVVGGGARKAHHRLRRALVPRQVGQKAGLVDGISSCLCGILGR